MSKTVILDSVTAFLQREHGQFIDGKATPATGTEHIQVVNPATEDTLAQVGSATEAEIDAAVASARSCFKGAWGEKSPYERSLLLNRFADVIEAHGEELAQIETLSTGKSIQMSRMLDVGQSAMSLRYYAGWATKIAGETLTPSFPSMQGENYTAMTLREPVGVVAGIVPWNFSVMIGMWKIGAALACGCTLVIKPSEFTPLTLLRVAELAIEAGLPAGALNIVNGTGQAGQQLINHPDIAKVSFTGSVPTGLKVGQSAMAANLTRCSLELGGKNSAALLSDADIDKAVAGLLQTGYVHQGQVCAAPERVYVPRSRLDELTSKMAAGLANAKIGCPLDESVTFGPISNRPQYDKVCHYLDIAGRESRILHGGNPIDGPGYFLEPTIVQTSSPRETLMQEEVFGPVISFMPYDDEDELLSLINDTPFGLSASLWTNDLSKALRMIPEIEAGTVWVNMHTFVDPAVPFGGVKSSGLGREFGSAFIEDYTELKSVMICY